LQLTVDFVFFEKLTSRWVHSEKLFRLLMAQSVETVSDVSSSKWGLSEDHYIKNDAQGVDVCLLA
jgi:hypothetical protein